MLLKKLIHISLFNSTTKRSYEVLTKDETVRFEKLTVRPGTHAVHSAWLQIDQHSTGYIFSLVAFIVVNIDALQLEFHQVLIGTCVLPGRLDAMFIADNFPELQRIKIMGTVCAP